MTMKSLGACRIAVPPYELATAMESLGGNVTLDAAGELCFYVGQVYLEGKAAGGTKTISSSGGKIHWRSGVVTFADAGTRIRIGIQDPSTSASPAQGDGTYDVYDDLVGVTDTIASSSVQVTTMSSGSKTLTHGQTIAIGWECISRAGADSVLVAYTAGTTTRPGGLFPSFASFLASTWARVVAVPFCLIEFDDGTVGWVLNGTQISTPSTSQAFNSGTGTANEYGNIFTFASPVVIEGVAIPMSISGNSADFEVCLYSDPLVSPSLIEAVVVDATIISATATATLVEVLFSSERSLAKNTAYGITVRPTTANNVTIYYRDWVAKGLRAEVLGESCYAIRRLSGAFSEYNGGTAATRRMSVSALLGSIDDATGAGGGMIVHPGMSGGMRG